ncbi:MAG: hypothetical protein MZW92_73565 [Comamonadaceae bacterium]|nr:hypothetical protein [Comamonadaceae bacterium]
MDALRLRQGLHRRQRRQPDGGRGATGGAGWFEVWLIPETLRATTFGDKDVGRRAERRDRARDAGLRRHRARRARRAAGPAAAGAGGAAARARPRHRGPAGRRADAAEAARAEPVGRGQVSQDLTRCIARRDGRPGSGRTRPDPVHLQSRPCRCPLPPRRAVAAAPANLATIAGSPRPLPRDAFVPSSKPRPCLPRSSKTCPSASASASPSPAASTPAPRCTGCASKGAIPYAYTANLGQPDETDYDDDPAQGAGLRRREGAPDRLPRAAGGRGHRRASSAAPSTSRTAGATYFNTTPLGRAVTGTVLVRGDAGGRRPHLGRRQHLQGQRHRALLPLRPARQPGAAHLQAVARPGASSTSSAAARRCREYLERAPASTTR